MSGAARVSEARRGAARAIRLVSALLSLLALAALSGCTIRGRDAGSGDAELDLSSWDFDARGPVNLRGRWEFLEGTLDVRALDDGATGRLSVPWTDAPSNDSAGRPIATQGVGVARLRVKLPPRRPSEGDLTLYLPYVYTAAEWHVRVERGEPGSPDYERGPEIVRAVGRPALTAADTVFQWRPVYVDVPVAEGATTIDLRVSIANFAHARFGIWQPPVVGSGNAMTAMRIAESGGEYLLVGLLLITAIHQFMMYALRKEEREPLWFGLFCATVAMRTLALRYAVQDLAPHLDAYSVLMRVEYGSVAVAPIFAALLVDGIVGGLPRAPLHAFLGAEVVVALCAALLPPVIVTGSVLRAAQLLVLPGGALIVGGLVRAWRTRRSEESVAILAGYVLLVLCGVTDVLSSQQIIDVPLLASWGLAIVVVSQSFVLARRNEQARGRSEDLLDALTTQSIELERKNADLARLDALKDEFLANTSHELRTPLNGIIGLTEAMLDGSAGALNPRAAQQLQLVVGAGRRLAALVDDVLDFAKLRHHELELRREPTDLHLHVELAVQLTRPLVKSAAVALRTEFAPSLPAVEADPNRLQQILLNLLGNAAKYTHIGEIVVATRHEGGRVFVTIRDTGIGIEADRRERIFQSFEQGDGGVSRRYGGTGLGLTIARELVELHGGTITVESEPGRGSAFTFSVPVSSREVDEDGLVELRKLIADPPSHDEPPPPSSTLEARPFGSPTILAVDDDETNLAVLAGQLEPEGYTVVTARDADEARERVASGRKFDLAIIDVMMPGTSGYDLCRELRTRFDPGELPILLLTARTQMQDLLEGFSAGASDYLHKPFSKRELRARIDAHMQVARATAAYGKFVPRQVLELLGRTPQDLRLGDTVHRTATVVVFDFASLTGFADDDGTPEAVSRLNDFFASSSQRIRAGGGVLHGRTSQAMTALFPGDSAAAVRVALRLVREYGAAFPIYAGVHHGEAIVAAVGDDGQIETSLLGDTERIASRLLGLTRVFGSHVLVSDDLLAALPEGHELAFRKLGRVQTKVSPDATVFHEVLDAEDLAHRYAKLQMADAFAQALAAYALGDFGRAGELFAAILDRNGYDGAAEFYRDLCESYAAQGPHSGFEGEVVFDVL
jgi:two-component system sensor histidine kinase ChiS